VLASGHAADEYAGRFLLELLQNAHDTHAAERHDGRIAIVVDATALKFPELCPISGDSSL
jgi:hypothetical protein